MNLSRRSLIKYTPAIGIGIAGCSSNGGSDDFDTSESNEEVDSDNDGVPDTEDDYPNDSSRNEQLRDVSDSRNIQEDEWYYYPLNFTQDGYIEYNFIVRDGPPIDAILIDESEYDSYESGERNLQYTEISSYDSAGDSVESPISSGNYRLIFDNSSRGRAEPPTDFDNNVAEVEFDITTSQ